MVGLLRSGYKIVNFLLGKTARITAIADGSEKEKATLRTLSPSNQIQWRFEEQGEAALRDQDLIITAVGHRSFAQALKTAATQNIPVLSELDFVSRYLKGKIVGITGTNGKSTTLSLLQAFLQGADASFAVGGMGDTAFIEALETPAPLNLFELSSTNLAESQHFHPHMAILTSLSPAHMERHRTTTDYYLTKSKVYALQDPEDCFIYHGHSEPVKKLLQRVPPRSQAIPFDYLQEFPLGIFRRGSELVWRYQGISESFSLAGFQLPGAQNIENLMAAIAAAKMLGLSRETILSSIPKLKALPYRLQYLGTIDGVKYFNDAKAANLAATAWALHALKKNVLLIAGGDFGPGQEDPLFREALAKHVKVLLIFGSRRRDFHRMWEGVTETYLVDTLSEAVQVAHQKAVKGDQVLFSPGAHPELHVHGGAGPRGEEFNAAVAEIKGRENLRRQSHPGMTRI